MKNSKLRRPRRHASLGLLPLLLALQGTPAQAQTLSLYGLVDAAITATSTGAPGGASVKGVGSGVLAASRWGLRGGEELGHGVKAFFTLEAGLDMDTGAAKPYAGNPATATPQAPNGGVGTGFNRRAIVGLESSTYGSLSLGRDYTPLFYAGLESDIFRFGLFGNLQAIVPLAGGVERWARVSNALFYRSPSWDGLSGRVAYSLGSESAGGDAASPPRHANEFVGLGVDYTTERLSLNASYQALTYPVVGGSPSAFTGATAQRKDLLLGARYALGALTVAGGYWQVGAPQRARNAWLGASVSMGQILLLGQLQCLHQDGPAGTAARKGTVLGLGTLYSLSKQTVVYASYGRVFNSANASFSLYASDALVAAAQPGADPRGLAVGVRQSF